MAVFKKNDGMVNFEIGNGEIYKDLFDNAHDLIHFAYPDGTLIYVNKAWSETLHYSNAEIQLMNIYSLVHAEDKEDFINYRSNVVQDNSVENQITVRLTTKEGKTVFVEGNISAKLQNGAAVYTMGIFRDVTKRVVYESALEKINSELKQERQKLETLIKNGPDAVIVIDEKSTIKVWNTKAELLFGWAAEEVLNTSLTDKIIPLYHRNAHSQGMERYLKTGEAAILNKTIEVTAINKQQEEFYISLTISQYKITDETLFIAFIRDISEERKNRCELEKKTKELERSNSSLEEFAFVASHDLKEPIRKIKFYFDVLNKKIVSQLGEDEKKYR